MKCIARTWDLLPEGCSVDESFTWRWAREIIFRNLEAEKISLLIDKHNRKK